MSLNRVTTVRGWELVSRYNCHRNCSSLNIFKISIMFRLALTWVLSKWVSRNWFEITVLRLSSIIYKGIVRVPKSWNIALGKIQFWFYNSCGRNTSTQQMLCFSIVIWSPALIGMWVHMVINMLFDLWLSGKSSSTVRHWTAIWALTLVGASMLV